MDWNEMEADLSQHGMAKEMCSLSVTNLIAARGGWSVGCKLDESAMIDDDQHGTWRCGG